MSIRDRLPIDPVAALRTAREIAQEIIEIGVRTVGAVLGGRRPAREERRPEERPVPPPAPPAPEPARPAPAAEKPAAPAAKQPAKPAAKKPAKPAAKKPAKPAAEKPAKKPAKPAAKKPAAKAAKPAKPAAKKPAKPAAEKPAKKPAKPAAKKPAQPAGAAPASPEERWQAFVADLPEQSRRFLELLEQRGALRVDEAVQALGLKGPKNVGGIIGALRRWAPKHGVELPVKAERDEKGRYWAWTGR